MTTIDRDYIEYTDENIQVQIGKALAGGRPFSELKLASRLENPLEKMLDENDKGKPFSVKIGIMHNVGVYLMNTIPEGEVQLLWHGEVLARFDTKESDQK